MVSCDAMSFLAAAVALLAVALVFHARKYAHMSAANDRLTASLRAATASVDALIARIPAPADEAPVLAAADALDALKVKVDAVDPLAPPAPPAAA